MAIIAIWWAFLAPVAFGGPASFVIVQGRSMEPAYSEGDLVVARAASEYRVDDVVIFRAADGRRYIIHRIVGGDSVSGWTTRGDGNLRADNWTVADEAIIGREWFVLPRVARAIAVVQEAPYRFAALVAFAVAALTLLGPPGSPVHWRAAERSGQVAFGDRPGLGASSETRAVAAGSPFDEIEARLLRMHVELTRAVRAPLP
jgi:signal peptidase